MLKNILIAALVILGIVVLIGYKIYNKPHLDIAKTEANFVLLQDVLINDFETNENEANIKYLDQLIEVTGPIAKITSEEGKKIISLGEDELFGNVDCHLSSDNNPQNLKVGQQITIKGVCTGYLMNVVLVRCVLKN